MSEDKAIVPYQGNQIIRSFDDAARAAEAMAKSGFFADSRNAAQAVVKILAGQEMGFGPFASMNGVYIIQGRPSIGANLMAAAVKKSGRYNYRVIEMTETTCSIEFHEGREKIGVSTFTVEDAKKAGTKNMDKYPRNMLFARAISNGIRWYCPDVFNGSTVYTPEELGATVNEDGEVIDFQPATAPVEVISNPPPSPANGKAQKQPAPADPVIVEDRGRPAPKMTRETAEAVKNSGGMSYGEIDNANLETIRGKLANALNKSGLAQSEKDNLQYKLDAVNSILYYREEENEAARITGGA